MLPKKSDLMPNVVRAPQQGGPKARKTRARAVSGRAARDLRARSCRWSWTRRNPILPLSVASIEAVPIDPRPDPGAPGAVGAVGLRSHLASLLAVAALTVLLRAPSFVYPIMDIDEGSYAAIASRMLTGGLPYRDGVENKFPAIFYHLRATRSPGAFEEVAGRVRAAHDHTRGMTFAERLSPNPARSWSRSAAPSTRPGHFHAVGRTRSMRRPASGRCAIRGRARRSWRVRARSPVTSSLFAAFHAVTAGIQIAVHELQGLQMLPMRILLDDPEALPQRWLAGEDAFQEARGGDVTADARIRALAGTTTDDV
jgi:hypothetical protein